ncbi:MAG: YqaJ viral recombinase family protein [Eubacterium sp.]|jgi:hypothetical protein|nr:YqaJ viral recombinase family protein [Eubacterium sp.]
MHNINWLDTNQIKIEPPKKPKKITATRFASVLGANPWASPFNAWCAITRTYEEPFVDNQYTVAGKTIEPIIFDYLRKSYMMDNLKTPTDLYGADYFQKTWGDFFPNDPICGGMWDALLYEDGKPSTIIEIKTSSRPQDWQTDVPENYKLQSALYAKLLGIDDVIMVAAFLSPADYDTPEKFKPSVKNTITVEFKVSQEYPNFSEMVEQAVEWWRTHVESGISPIFDEKKDADILKELRTNSLSPDTDVTTLIAEAEELKTILDKAHSGIEETEQRYKSVSEMLKKHAMSNFRDGDTKVNLAGNRFTWSLARTESTTIDKDALKADGLLEKYSKPSVTYRMTVK